MSPVAAVLLVAAVDVGICLLALVVPREETDVFNEDVRVGQLHVDELDIDAFYRNGITESFGGTQ